MWELSAKIIDLSLIFVFLRWKKNFHALNDHKKIKKREQFIKELKKKKIKKRKRNDAGTTQYNFSDILYVPIFGIFFRFIQNWLEELIKILMDNINLLCSQDGWFIQKKNININLSREEEEKEEAFRWIYKSRKDEFYCLHQTWIN